MSYLAIILLVISALIHAWWNILGKREARPSKEFFFLANIFACIIFSPILIVSQVLFSWDYSVWLCIILTGLFEAIYFTFVAKSYRHGDISVAYPISRSIPIILVILISIIFNHNVSLTILFILGSILVVIGCLITAMKHFRDFKVKSYFDTSCKFAYIAAIASAGYLITDDKALHLLKYSTFFDILELSTLYSFIRGVSISCFMGLSIIFKSKQRMHTYAIIKERLGNSILAGLSMYLSYTLVLVSMYLVTNLSYVALFRQLSIPVTVIAGTYLFKEKVYLTKITGIALILLGLTLALIPQ